MLLCCGYNIAISSNGNRSGSRPKHKAATGSKSPGVLAQAGFISELSLLSGTILWGLLGPSLRQKSLGGWVDPGRKQEVTPNKRLSY